MEWAITESWQRHTKASFLALRIVTEILLFQRGKRLEGKPDPKGNAKTYIINHLSLVSSNQLFFK
jgi:hypothetical protein